MTPEEFKEIMDIAYGFRNLDVKDNTLVAPINLPKKIKSAFKETVYNLDYDTEVDAFLMDMKNNPKLRQVFEDSLNKNRNRGNWGHATSANVYRATIDALNKKDPKGFRKVGRDAIEGYERLLEGKND